MGNLFDEYVKVPEAAKMLGVTRMTAHRWLKKGLLPYEQVDGTRVIAKGDIQGFLDTCICPYCHRYNPIFAKRKGA